jgi:hypothetical protein
MHKILEKIADWLVEKEEKEAEKCDIPDEVVNEWLETLKARKKQALEVHGKNSEEYAMLKDLLKKVEYIKAIRKKKCEVK